jgi:septal ring factor EnvC (AmiA/AmiB activator)
MPDERDLLKLHAMLEAVSAERSAAESALEEHLRQSEEQSRLLMEEQDRFVSRLLSAQERDLGKLRLELEEARTTAERLEHKLRRDREGSERLEEELAKSRMEIDRLREQRDVARVESQRGREAEATLRARVDQLEANLALARAMLDDAMGETDPSAAFTAARTPVSVHRRLRPDPPRESGFRRPTPARQSSCPPGLAPAREYVRSETPRGTAVGGVFLRSRPPR